MHHKFPEVLYTWIRMYDVEWAVMDGCYHSNVPKFSLPMV